MNKNNRGYFCAAGLLFVLFLAWTAAIQYVDVQPIGPENSSVGFASLNGCVQNLTGVHMRLYVITDWLGLAPLFTALGFAFLGLAQLIRRKSLCKVDSDILVLGGFYVVVMAAYILFEAFSVNYRPVLIGGRLEASYPSSTTLLVLCVMPTAAMQLQRRVKREGVKRVAVYAIDAFTVFMVLGRLISGVHWLTDIVGAMLLSASLVTLYHSVNTRIERVNSKKRI